MRHSKRRVRVFGIAACLLAGGASLDCTDDPAKTSPLAERAEGGVEAGTSSTITPGAGGVVKSSDGRVTLVLPPGAVASDTVITITPASSYFDDGRVVPGSVYTFGPEGITFAAPVAMTIAYDPTHLPAATTEADLRIHKAGVSSWILSDSGYVDASAHAAHAVVHGFSSYGIRAISSVADASADGDVADAVADHVETSVPAGDVVVASAGDGPNNTYPPNQLRVFDGYAYWTQSTIKRAPVTGGAVTTLVSGLAYVLDGDAYGRPTLTKIGSTLYFDRQEERIWSMPETGGTPQTHASPMLSYGTFGLVTDGTSLYWTGLYANTATGAVVFRISTTPSCGVRPYSNATCGSFFCPNNDLSQFPPLDNNCTQQGADVLALCCDVPEVFAAPQSPPPSQYPSRAFRLVIDGGYAYWTENSNTNAWLVRKALSGGNADVLTTEARASKSDAYDHVAVGGGAAYVQRHDGFGHDDVIVVPTAGGGASVLFAAPVTSIVADESNVYLATAGSGSIAAGIYRRAHTGGAPVRIADARDPGEMAIDTTHVYWFARNPDATTTLRRLAK